MANTTNFNWETPDDTDLVKDGAAAMRTLGNSIDTSFVDLKGGTTGQILSKASNTDLDYTWVTTDDANAIQNAIVDAKGDLIAATAADTPARLAVGADYGFLQALASASTGLTWNSGDWTDFTTVVTSGTGSITSYTEDAKYIRIGKVCIFRFGVTITNAGTGAGFLSLSLPFTVKNDTAVPIGSGRENALTGKMLQVQAIINATAARIYNYDNSTVIATNAYCQGLLVYEVV